MNKFTMASIAGCLTIATMTVGFAGITHAGNSTMVTPETFIRAETDRMFQDFAKNAGGSINEFFYIRNPTPLDAQTVIRMNKDTLYMGAVID